MREAGKSYLWCIEAWFRTNLVVPLVSFGAVSLKVVLPRPPGTTTHVGVQPRVRCSTAYWTTMIELYFRLGLGIRFGLRLRLS